MVGNGWWREEREESCVLARTPGEDGDHPRVSTGEIMVQAGTSIPRVGNVLTAYTAAEAFQHFGISQVSQSTIQLCLSVAAATDSLIDPGRLVLQRETDMRGGAFRVTAGHLDDAMADMIMSKKGRLTALFRVFAVALCGFLWTFQQKADHMISLLWQTLLDSWLFQHESFEVCRQMIIWCVHPGNVSFF